MYCFKQNKSKSVISIIITSFLLLSSVNALSFSFFSFNNNVEKSGTTTNFFNFKGLSVEDLEQKEIEIKEKKAGEGQTLQNTNLALRANENIVEQILEDVEDGAKGSTDNEITYYEVKKGDTIQSIATYFEISPETIISVNEDSLDNGKAVVGDILEIPSISGLLYQIKKGDNLLKIAKRYNIDDEDISLYNGLANGDSIKIGSYIFLPNAKPIKEVKTVLAKKSNSKNNNNNVVSKTVADVIAISKLHRDGKNYASLPKLNGYFINPAPGAVRSQKLHGNNGADLANRLGSPILAAASGKIVVARDSGWNYGYGKYIVIEHNNGTQTVYAHLSQLNVTVGQFVNQGSQIGLMGSTGRSTGPHLHFEVRGAFNPFAW